ncbi:MAG TPA: hypothetical protein VGQ91_13965 [Ideonella sp.]|nr:hypothetical protein [Ideonella sp.]
MQKSYKSGVRPAYFDGQLLQRDDFVAEQRYHRHARRRHNITMHDWGVVSGLEVSVSGDHQITVRPGVAIDANGNEIDLGQAMPLEVGSFPAHTRLRVTLYQRNDEEHEREQRNRIHSHAVVTVSDGLDEKATLLLATLQIDAAGKPDPRSIDVSGVRYARTRLTPGSVGVPALAEQLRRAWVAMPFRGWPLEKGPDGSKNIPPPFRMGTTETRSHDRWDGAENTRGGGGTMPIVIPFGAQRVLRFRMAGVENDKHIDFHLVRGGFDTATRSHARKILLEKTIKGRQYNEVYTIDDGGLDPEHHTLALWVCSRGKASISLVALEFSIEPG